MSELNEQTGAVPEPPYLRVLNHSGLAPEVFAQLTPERRQEYVRSYLATQAATGEDE